MARARTVVWVFWVSLAVPCMGRAFGQSYPHKPIRIVTTGIGGGLDFIARLIAPELSSTLGQSVVVDNRTNSVVPVEIVSRAQPDGYTLLVSGPPLWIGPLLQNASYNPVKDFSPITLAGSSPNIIVVPPSLPVNSVQDLISLAKARPKSLNYASNAIGGSSHLAAELFKSMAGIDMVRIPYNSNATLVADLMSGQVQLTFGSAVTVESFVQSGKLKALAVTSAKPSALFPNLPTVASAVPGYEAVSMFGIFAPANTAAAIIHRLNHEIVRMLEKADVKEKLIRSGVEAVGNSPQEFAVMVASDMARMGKVIRDSGIRTE